MLHYPEYTRGTLLSIWIFRLLLSAVVLALAVRAYIVVIDDISWTKVTSDPGSAVAGAFGLLAGIAIATIVLDITEVILYKVHRLHPVFLLVANVLKLGVWLVYLGLCIWASIVIGTFSFDMIIALALCFFCIWALVYSSMVVHKWRREKRYGSVRQADESRYYADTRTEVSQYA